MNSFITRGGWWVVAQSGLMLAVLAGGVAFRAGERGGALLAAGGCLIVLGAVFGLAGVKALGRNRTAFPKPREDSALVQHGVYALVRHPLYTSVILVSFGWALVWGSLPALALACLEAVFFDAKARREERWLTGKFPGYADYRRRVRRLVPQVY